MKNIYLVNYSYIFIYTYGSGEEETYVGKRMRQMVVGKRKRGRPKRRWQDCIDDDLKGLGVREEDALDRREWRRIIRTGDPRDWE